MAATSYDEVRYPSAHFRRTHPLTVALPAALFGLKFARPETARVLEIGCGEGGNLIPMAVAYPQARFLGFDLAATAIETGRRTIAALGLTNIELLTLDILEAGPALGQFDYVIAHGVYSWVPAPVREATLRLIGQCLAPDGLAYVSYNTLPGCHYRMALREMIMHHLEGVEGFDQRVARTHEFLRLFIDKAPDNNPKAVDLKTACKEMLERDPHVLFHDELGETYDPVYLHEFVAEAGRFSLECLGEPRGPWWREELFPTPIGEALSQLLGDDRDELHQYLDFLHVRTYRQSILTHAGRVAGRKPELRCARDLWVAGDIRSLQDAPDLTSSAEVKFKIGAGEAAVGQPVLKQALHAIGAAWPRSVAGADLPDDPDVHHALLQLFILGELRLDAGPSPAALTAGERPLASPFARAQLAGGDVEVAALDHMVVDLSDAADRAVLSALDGSRDREALKLILAEGLDARLERFARLSLLVR